MNQPGHGISDAIRIHPSTDHFITHISIPQHQQHLRPGSTCTTHQQPPRGNREQGYKYDRPSPNIGGCQLLCPHSVVHSLTRVSALCALCLRPRFVCVDNQPTNKQPQQQQQQQQPNRRPLVQSTNPRPTAPPRSSPTGNTGIHQPNNSQTTDLEGIPHPPLAVTVPILPT